MGAIRKYKPCNVGQFITKKGRNFDYTLRLNCLRRKCRCHYFYLIITCKCTVRHFARYFIFRLIRNYSGTRSVCTPIFFLNDAVLCSCLILLSSAQATQPERGSYGTGLRERAVVVIAPTFVMNGFTFSVSLLYCIFFDHLASLFHYSITSRTSRTPRSEHSIDDVVVATSFFG